MIYLLGIVAAASVAAAFWMAKALKAEQIKRYAAEAEVAALNTIASDLRHNLGHQQHQRKYWHGQAELLTQRMDELTGVSVRPAVGAGYNLVFSVAVNLDMWGQMPEEVRDAEMDRIVRQWRKQAGWMYPARPKVGT